MLQFLRQRWFLLALLGVLVGGMLLWKTAKPLAGYIPRNLVVGAVMFLMALPMETGAMWLAVRRPGPAWLAAAINLGLAPPLGWLAAGFLPEELSIGVFIATVVPCTLAAATVWTRRAGGSDAVAILVTMITNLACFLVIPSWLNLFIGDVGAFAGIEFGDMVLQLALLVVSPIVVAQLLRQWRPVAQFAIRHKTALGACAQIGILSFVFVGAARCGEELENATNGQALSLGNVSLMIVLVVAIHLALFGTGMAAARGLRMSRPDGIAVGIAGSQKTIMVGLHLALQFGSLAILPMIAYHAGQLVLDTIIADRLRLRGSETTSPAE
jgi:sodium/bile acid cotransporter 7